MVESRLYRNPVWLEHRLEIFRRLGVQGKPRTGQGIGKLSCNSRLKERERKRLEPGEKEE